MPQVMVVGRSFMDTVAALMTLPSSVRLHSGRSRHWQRSMLCRCCMFQNRGLPQLWSRGFLMNMPPSTRSPLTGCSNSGSLLYPMTTYTIVVVVKVKHACMKIFLARNYLSSSVIMRGIVDTYFGRTRRMGLIVRAEFHPEMREFLCKQK